MESAYSALARDEISDIIKRRDAVAGYVAAPDAWVTLAGALPAADLRHLSSRCSDEANRRHRFVMRIVSRSGRVALSAGSSRARNLQISSGGQPDGARLTILTGNIDALVAATSPLRYVCRSSQGCAKPPFVDVIELTLSAESPGGPGGNWTAELTAVVAVTGNDQMKQDHTIHDDLLSIF